MIPPFAYTRATSVREAVAALATPGARVSAGGTDLLGCARDGVFALPGVVSIGRIEALHGISEAAGGLRIGATTTIADIARHPLVTERYQALAEAAASVASPQLRNQGTLGGNLCQRPRCWFFRGGYDCARKGGDACYAMQGDNRYHCLFGGSACLIVHPSDTATALVALGASVAIAGPRGERVVPIEEFFVLPEVDVTRENVLATGELVTEVRLPAPSAGARSTYRKVRRRGAWDFALAAFAASVRTEAGKVREARLVLGAAAPVPWRAREAEKAVLGQKLDAKVVQNAAAAAVRGASPLEDNGYKVPMFRGLVEEVLSGLA